MIDSVPVSLLTDEDEKDIFLFENDDNAILAQAAQSLRVLSEYDPTNLPPVEEYQKSPSLRSYEPAGEDCAEWLQMRQRSVASHVKTYARYLKGSGYELDDLIQEANLAIFSGWNAYDPATGSRDSFCWYIVYNKMRGLCRKALSQKRNLKDVLLVLVGEERDRDGINHVRNGQILFHLQGSKPFFHLGGSHQSQFCRNLLVDFFESIIFLHDIHHSFLFFGLSKA